MVVSGSGNVAIYTIDKVSQLGERVVACSDSSGYAVDDKGIDLELLKEARSAGDSAWTPTPRPAPAPPCEVALPSATENEIGDEDVAREAWSFEESERRLEEIMRRIHDRCAATADEYGLPGNYVAGANIAGFTRVADAMLALGVV